MLRAAASCAAAALALLGSPPTSTAQAAEADPVAAGRTLVWQAEFDGTLGPDIVRRGNGCTPPSNYWFSNGNLVTMFSAGIGECRYHRVALTTEGQRTFGFGRFVVRAKLSTAPGAHNGVFMVGARGDWPAAGEINLSETTGNTPHTHFRFWSARQNDPDARCGLPVNANLPYGWHTYFVERGRDWAALGADGQVHVRYTKAQYTARGCTWPFNEPFFFNINQSGGGYGGTVKWLPFTSRIDWIRYYR